MKADKIFLGNIITMDEQRPFAEALTLTDGRITYVGDKDVAEKLCDDKTEVCDYTGKYIYPGFMESHCHPGMAGFRAIGQANLWDGECMEDYTKIMKKFMEEHPGKPFYVGGGWHEFPDQTPDAKYLDDVSTEIPIAIQTRDGHSLLLNHKAMEILEIDAEYAKTLAPGQVRVDSNGNPTGYVSEEPVMKVMPLIAGSVEDMKEYILWWQDFFIKMGFTAAGNAGIELSSVNELIAFSELDKEGKLKINNFAWSIIPDNAENPEKEVQGIVEKQKKYGGKKLSILGPKIFFDGVIEAHTGWLLEEYTDQPGYYGVPRYNDADKVAELTKACATHGLSVHAHTIGDAAVKCFLDGVCKGQEESGNMDMRNIAVHLQVVRPEDIKRFGQYNIIPGSGLIWASNDYHDYYQEIEYIGEERVKRGYPAKSFLDTGARMVNHTDFPVSSIVKPTDIISALSRGFLPGNTEKEIRNIDEVITRKQALESLTINVAYEFKKEHELGSLEIGKIGNMTIYDTDFLNCDGEDIGKAKHVATVIDGEICG